MEKIKCIFCEKENDQIVIEENGYAGRKCSKCGLIYISPRPFINEIHDLYGHSDAHISPESHISGEFSRRLRAKHNLKILNSYLKKGTMLEIGAGAGYFLDEARKLGFEPYGIELNPVQAKFIRDELKIPCEESSLNMSIFKGMEFSVIYHCNVISHFSDPISEFKKIYEKMKDGGILIFETGNLGEVKQKYFKCFQKFQYPDHLFFFSSENLIELLERTGFEFIKMYRYSILPRLVATKAFSVIKNLIKNSVVKSKWQGKHASKKSSTGNPPCCISDNSTKTNSIIRKILRILDQYFYYILCYYIGRIAPKKHRPQTVIVIARKGINK